MITQGLKTLLSLSTAAGLGIVAGMSPPAPTHPPARPKQEFRWPSPPLEGATPSPAKPLEIRGFSLGQCAIPADAPRAIARAAHYAARLSQTNQQGTATIVGGADGTPILSLRRKCAVLTALPGTLNQRLAAARASIVKQLFLAEFDKAGGNRSTIKWIELPPIVTADIHQSRDRNAVLRIVWTPRLIGSAEVSGQGGGGHVRHKTRR
jgi:hypothetical protein